MKPEKAAWLKRTVEAPLDPAQPIVDPHHHLWSRPGNTYLHRELHADTRAGHNVKGTVFVECRSGWRESGSEAMRPVGETEFVAAEAQAARQAGGAPILGIVAFADLALGEAVEDVLLAHETAGQGLFRGIRHPTSCDAELGSGHIPTPAGLMGTDRFERGFARLGALGYSYDAWLFHHQLPELLTLVRRHPQVPVVLDHIGGPLGVGRFTDRRDDVRQQWRPVMQALAGCASVTLKVGGIGMDRYYGGGWPTHDSPPDSAELYRYWGDDLHWCIDQFGPTRCMFESNFPVDRDSCSYTTLWNVFQRVGQAYTQAERDELFYGTALRAYRLALD